MRVLKAPFSGKQQDYVDYLSNKRPFFFKFGETVEIIGDN